MAGFSITQPYSVVAQNGVTYFLQGGAYYSSAPPNYAAVTLPGLSPTPVGSPATVNPMGEQRVTLAPYQLLFDSFDTTTLDITNRWLATSGSGGSVPSSAQGFSTLAAGTTASGYSQLQSQAAFPATWPGYLEFMTNINVEYPVTGVGNRFWGYGTTPATPTLAAPRTDAVGFELFTDGNLYAVTYIGGTRTIMAALGANGSGQQPADAAPHKFWIYRRGESFFWCIDNQDNIVAQAQTGAVGPNNNTLPLLVQSISAGAVGANSLTVNAIGTSDTSHSGITLGDGTFGWRKQTVTRDGGSVQAVGGTTTVAVAAAGSANVKSAPGRLCRVLVTVAGTVSLTFYDNATGAATGTIIGITPATTTVGQVLDFNLPAAVGISCVGAAGTPGVTIGFN